MNTPQNNLPPSIIGRLRSELGLKLILLALLNLWVYVPYLYLQQHHFFPATNLPAGFIDRLIPFSDQMVWPYLSIYLLMPVGPFLMTNRRRLLQYAAGIVLISLFADLIFLFWPTTCPRSALPSANAAYQTLTRIDNSFHACPSLHAAFAIYSALCGSLVLGEFRGGRLWQTGVWLWALLILYATLATKQHVLVDIAAGSALGFGIYGCVFDVRISIFKRKSLAHAVVGDQSTNL